MRGGAVAARRAHNPKVAGSNPAPATIYETQLTKLCFSFNPKDYGWQKFQHWRFFHESQSFKFVAS